MKSLSNTFCIDAIFIQFTTLIIPVSNTFLGYIGMYTYRQFEFNSLNHGNFGVAATSVFHEFWVGDNTFDTYNFGIYDVNREPYFRRIFSALLKLPLST